MNATRFSIGQRHGRNVVLNYKAGGKTTKVKWLVRCDCGDERWVATSVLSKNTSGCRACYHLSQRKEGEAHGITAAWKSLRTNAFSRGYEVLITKDEFVEIARGLCYYCGEEPTERSCYDLPAWSTPAKINGIDRIDNNKGYVEGNCVACCKTCNKAKDTFSVDEFYAWIDKVNKWKIK